MLAGVAVVSLAVQQEVAEAGAAELEALQMQMELMAQ
jgi:hypothetical protein